WGICEINQQLPYHCQDFTGLIFIGLSCAVLMVLSRRLVWRPAAWPTLGLLPVMSLVALHSFCENEHLFLDAGWLAWPLTFILLYYCLWRGRDQLPARTLACKHVASYLLLVLIITSEVSWLAHHFIYGNGCWNLVAWGFVPAGLILLVQNTRLEQYWPLSDYGKLYQERGAGIVVFLLWCWLLSSSIHSPGNPAPLSFIPLLNPLELSQLAVMLLLFRWIFQHQAYATSLLPERFLLAASGMTVFIWLNAALARAVHHGLGVSFVFNEMLASRFYQASVSILWGLLSLVLMVIAERRQNRVIWLMGIILIGATVAKLFLLDLAGSGTIERIVSFLAVGTVLMIIGYFFPLPPAEPLQEEE
ncbi:MAG: DUF2339 domain-containing protein, partial [Candidatus Electrothrix sp. AR3]|nr:DUF2339 domain-containing protein [Candidatus Electrothrix sp. AR3]